MQTTQMQATGAGNRCSDCLRIDSAAPQIRPDLRNRVGFVAFIIKFPFRSRGYRSSASHDCGGVQRTNFEARFFNKQLDLIAPDS
jgi:hypothetical protein